MGLRRKIAVIGLGYVGLPVAVAFAREGFEVVGFDIDSRRIDELKAGHDRTREVTPEELGKGKVLYTTRIDDLQKADFLIVTVPTPIDDQREPDMSIVLAASRTVGKALKKGDIVVYESTVYPGATEEECVPILEAVSGLVCGTDFTVGYSPERINPGDRQHRLETIVKVVSGQDARTLDIVAETYAAVVTAGVHRAPSIKTAEAAKVIENTQRDLNIALMNELALIFARMDIDTADVLAAAGTKWNFLPFRPGLVGGHCIGVDPYYLTHKAQKLGLDPKVVLAGREANDGMGRYVAREALRLLGDKASASPLVTVLGITFKEDVPDIRNSKVVDIIHALEKAGAQVQVADPEADPDEVEHEYGLRLTPQADLKPAHAIVLATAHKALIQGGWPGITRLLDGGGGPVLDVKSVLDRASVPDTVQLWRL